MIRKNAASTVLVFLAVISLSGSALAQGEAEDDAKKKDPGSENAPSEEGGEGETEKEGEDEAGESEEEAEKDETGEIEEAEEEPDEDEEPLKLDAPKTPDLDMTALGDIDPEKDLAEGGSVDEDTASAQATEEWTERELDILELHGYFRLRPELYDNFNIRGDSALYDRSAVNKYNQESMEDFYLGEDCRDKGGRRSCKNSSMAGANMRFRLEPTLNISEEVWIKSQIDFLDNVMLGSTPRFWQNYGETTPGLIETGRIQGWNMGPPGPSDMIVVRRVWGEVMTPLGQLRFGRMGDHWGLGMLHNAGNGLNQDFGDSVDRIMFAAKINDWMIAPAFDFPNEGVSSSDASGRPFDVSQLDDAYQLVGIIAYKHDREDQLAMIKRGDWLINTGIYFSYRWQVLSFEQYTGEGAPEDYDGENVFYRRDMWAITPDFWFQFLVDTFHLELEAALIYGEIGNPDRDLIDFDDAQALTLIQYGGVIQVDYGLLSDQLRIGLEVGFAMGDEDVEGLRAPSTYDQMNGQTNGKYTAFSFNPAYNTDLILYHHILGSVSQSYYFNAWLRYDFLKSAMGRKIGLQVDALYSRAVFDQSTINNNSANLGVELNAQAMYVSEDGFHAGLQYGVLFPLAGFKGTPEWDSNNEEESPYMTDNDLSIPQTVQIFLGISF
ncbi:MAG: TIGR04551 family protein [Deltaproteobacteria bacterium]|nr:TIGR04551 family protein [Deltaproteobacteria bacterium]